MLPQPMILESQNATEIHTYASDQKGSVQTRKASRQRQNCARNLECGSRRLTSTVKICTRTQYIGLAEQCQQTLAGPAMNFGADLALAAQKA
jgi:hypothetical protein